MTLHLSPQSLSPKSWTPKVPGLEAYLSAQADRDVLRFITCGSVDDGKSTLIGRLLHDTKQLFEDQLTALESDSRRHGTQGEGLDFALLVDGLSAEREQGITIDVAYRFFATARRSFIVADTPGHEQYTPNMATGASTADLAVLLVDARRGITRQTRRHSLIASMLGIRHVVVAVNKMDLVGWSADAYAAIMRDYRAFAAGLSFEEVVGVPVSALSGDNIAAPSPSMPWHAGPTLLGHLEEVRIRPPAAADFRMPVQGVSRPNLDFRGFAGIITSGRVEVGARVRAMPSGRETSVVRIVTFDGDRREAAAGESVTLTLGDDVDISRGDVIASVEAPPRTGDRIAARLFWMAERPLVQGASYLLKLGAQTVAASVVSVHHRLDLATLAPSLTAALAANDVGDVELALDRAIAFDSYAQHRETGSFILIDPESYDTAAMGLVLSEEPIPAATPPGPRTGRLRSRLPPAREHHWRSIVKAISWRITGSLDTTFLAFLFTRDARIAAAIGLTEVATKIVLYYGHERIWARIRFGLRPLADEGSSARPPSQL